MKHYILIAALGEIFYGFVSGQNFYNNDPSSNYGNFQNTHVLNHNGQPFGQNIPSNGFQPQSSQNFYNSDPNSNYGNIQNNPVLNQNDQTFGQNSPSNGFQPQLSDGDWSQRRWFPQQQRRFLQPPTSYLDSTMNNGGASFSQPQDSFQRQDDGGYNLPWNDPSQTNSNPAADQIGNNPSQYSYDSNMQPPNQAKFNDNQQRTGYWPASNQGTNSQPGFNRGRRFRLRRRRRRRRKNQPGAFGEAETNDQSPGIEGSSFPKPEWSTGDERPVEGNTQTGEESSSNGEQIPTDEPNDYPGFAYPPGFFGDMLEGLGDSNRKSNSQSSGMVKLNNSRITSSDNSKPRDTSNLNNNDQVPPGIPNDYPGEAYPPGFFSDMLGGLDDSTMATDDEDYSPDMTEGFDASTIAPDYADFTTSMMGGSDNSTTTTDDGGNCGENEETTDCMSPCNTCAANCKSCMFRSCETGCDCLDGYKRDSNGECIHASFCPPCAAPTSTTEPYSSK